MSTDYFSFNHLRFREYVAGLTKVHSLRELSRLTDHRISYITFSKWQRGHRPNIELFFVFCEAFDLPPALFAFDRSCLSRSLTSNYLSQLDSEV